MAYTDYIDEVQKLYIAYYQRPGDPDGVRYWAQRMEAAGGNYEGIINAFADSQESMDLYGEINNDTIDTIVNNMYNALFGRDAEPEAPDKPDNYYVRIFKEGNISAGELALAILKGAQNDDAVDIANKLDYAKKFTDSIDPDGDYITTDGSAAVTYDGEADCIAARALLAQVTSTTPRSDAQIITDLQTKIADTGDPILDQTTGQTFVLTTGQDYIPGTMGNDEVIGIIDAANDTFTLGDVINGGADADTVTITTNQSGMNLGDVTLNAIEHFVVDARTTNVGDIDVDGNALETFTLEGNGKTWTDNASVRNVNASTEMTFSDFDADGYNLDVYVNEESSAVNVAVNLTDVDNVNFELALDDSADGTAPDDVVTFTLDGVKNSNNNTYIYTSDAETLNVVVAGDSAVEAIGDYYNNDGSDMGNTVVNLTLNGNLAVGFWDMNDSGGPTENTTFNITGAGDLYIDDLDDYDSNLTIAAGAATGDIEIYDIEPEAVSVTTGSGDDVIEIKNSATVVALNKGDDKVIVGSPITVDSTGPVDVVDADLDGGDNYDTLEITADNALTSETNVAASPNGLAVSDAFANFERLSLTSVAAVGTAAIDATAWGLGDDVVLDGAADFFTLTVNDAAKVEVTGTTASPTSLVIDVDGAASAADNGLTLTINGANGIDVGTQIAEVETVNLVSTAIDTDGASNVFSMTAAELVTLNISGDVALSSFPPADVFTALKTVNAADFDAGLSIDVSSSAQKVTITTGDGADYVIGSAQNDTISVGNGGNTVVGGQGLDTITLGSGVTENDFDAIGYNAMYESQGVTVDVIKGFQVNVQSTDDINGDTVVDGDDLINDVIDLSAVVMGTAVYSGEASGYGAVLTSLIGDATNSQAVLDVSTSTLYVDVNADAILDNNDMAITLTGVTDLSDANFVF